MECMAHYRDYNSKKVVYTKRTPANFFMEN